MDFSPLTDALASKSYGKIADICDELMLKGAAEMEGVPFEEEWPFAIHLLAHIYVNDINSARFLWKSIPAAVKERQPEVVAAWRIGQRLWTRDYAAVHEAIRAFDWSQQIQPLVVAFSEVYTKRMFQLLLSAYSTIGIQDTALFLGMNEDDATNYVVQQGWVVDPDSRMLTVKKQPVKTEQKLDSSKLHRLTEQRVRETMETAFWDSVMESMKQDEPKYDRVVQLVGEVRDGIQELAPESWKDEIVETIDLDLLSQVLNSGNLDIGYCGKILEFGLVTLQKLSSPAQEDEMKALHQKLLKELAETCQIQDELKHPHIAAMIKGLRSVLGQIQARKQDISKVRRRMMEPLLTGPAGFDYLRKAFANHYGSDLDACISPPLTMQWLSSVKNSEDQEWEEHQNTLFSFKIHDRSSQVSVPFTTLRTGGSFLVKTNGSAMGSTYVASETGTRATW